MCIQLQQIVFEGHGGCRDLFAAKLSLDDSVVVVQRHEYILQVIVSDGESVGFHLGLQIACRTYFGAYGCTVLYVETGSGEGKQVLHVIAYKFGLI